MLAVQLCNFCRQVTCLGFVKEAGGWGRGGQVLAPLGHCEDEEVTAGTWYQLSVCQPLFSAGEEGQSRQLERNVLVHWGCRPDSADWGLKLQTFIFSWSWRLVV